MKVLVSVDLDNLRQEDVEVLTARIKDAAVDFNNHTRAVANVRRIHYGADDIFDRKRREVLMSIQRT
jgi:hypothetical protein